MIGPVPRRFHRQPPIAAVLYALQGRYRSGVFDGEWYAECPVCGGGELLWITERGEELVFKCFAGCDEQVIQRQLAGRVALETAAERDRERARAARLELEDRSRTVRLPDPPSSLPEGERNRGLFAYAAALRNAGLQEPEIREHLDRVNEAICFPPLSDASLRTISRSVMRYAPSTRAAPAPGVLSRFQAVLRRRDPYDPFA